MRIGTKVKNITKNKHTRKQRYTYRTKKERERERERERDRERERCRRKQNASTVVPGHNCYTHFLATSRIDECHLLLKPIFRYLR